MNLDKDYWEGKYFADTTGWDIGYVSPQLVLFFESLSDKDARILIPGCGNGHEAIWFAAHGFTQVSVIDLAKPPLDHVTKKTAGKINCIQGDFFELTGQYDLIIEQTFFCALDPDLRKPYVEQMARLLAPNGRLVGLLFDTAFDQKGPPFGGSAQEYKQLFTSHFDFKKLDKSPHSIPSRLGREVFFECVVKNKAPNKA